MTAIAQRRRQRTLAGAVVALVLVLSASVMFGVGVVTLSNSQEGEAVGVDDRPREEFPSTPNALLVVEDDNGDLASLAVLTLLPEGQGGSIVTVPVNADATSGFDDVRRPLADEFDPADPEALVASVEEMLSITIQRAAVVEPDVLEQLLEPIGTVGVVLPHDAVGAGDGAAATDDDLGAAPGDQNEELVAAAGQQSLTPSAAVDVLTASSDDSAVAHANDVAVWEALASAAPLVTPPEAIATDDLGRPIPPTSVEELAGLLFDGEVAVRDLALAPNPPSNAADVDTVVIDRRDSAMVFAQVSPALVSTPNPGLKIRVVASYTDEQIAESNGLFTSRAGLLADFIGQMLFLQNNVVSVAADETGAPDVTVIEVADPRLLEQVRESAPAVFGEAEVLLADRVLEGIDIEVDLGMSYIARQMVRSGVDGDVSGAPADTGASSTTVLGNG